MKFPCCFSRGFKILYSPLHLFLKGLSKLLKGVGFCDTHTIKGLNRRIFADPSNSKL